MRLEWMTLLMLTTLGGCGLLGNDGKYSVYFEPYSAALDGSAGDTIHDAAAFAQAHPARPVVVTGYSAPPDPKQDVEGLSDQRAEAVKQGLIADGIRPNRIVTVGRGVTDPQNLPTVAVRRVDISVGP
jgi:outer membrane protein OmpA-like peptidoglycan-associated protein